MYSCDIELIWICVFACRENSDGLINFLKYLDLLTSLRHSNSGDSTTSGVPRPMSMNFFRPSSISSVVSMSTISSSLDRDSFIDSFLSILSSPESPVGASSSLMYVVVPVGAVLFKTGLNAEWLYVCRGFVSAGVDASDVVKFKGRLSHGKAYGANCNELGLV